VAWERKPFPRLQALLYRDRLGLLTVGQVLVTHGEVVSFLADPPAPTKELRRLDRFEGSQVQSLFRDSVAALGLEPPGVTAAVGVLAVEHAQSIATGHTSPREGAWRIVEVMYEGEDLDAPPALLTVLAEFHKLMSNRDDAEELVAANSGAAAERFAGRMREWDRLIRAEAEKLLTRVGVDRDADLETLQARALEWIASL
jgi:hypothetical protein